MESNIATHTNASDSNDTKPSQNDYTWFTSARFLRRKCLLYTTGKLFNLGAGILSMCLQHFLRAEREAGKVEREKTFNGMRVQELCGRFWRLSLKYTQSHIACCNRYNKWDGKEYRKFMGNYQNGGCHASFSDTLLCSQVKSYHIQHNN